MESEDKEEKKNVEKVKIYINIEPIGLKFGYVFKKSDSFQTVINFVYNQVKKLGVKFELGRINENKTGAILLTESIIGDFLENNEEITVYSEEYGFTRTNLAGEDEHSSLKKIFYLKSVSDLYKSMNFLKKKRNEKLKQKNNLKKIEKKEIKKEEKNKEKDSEQEKEEQEEKEEKEEQEEKSIELDEEKEEKKEKEEKNKQKSNRKNSSNEQNKIEKIEKKNKTEKKEKKYEEKEKTAKKNDEKEKTSKKTNEKKTEKKLKKNYLALDDEDEEENED